MDNLSKRPPRSHYGDDADQFVEISHPAGEPVGTVISIHGGYWRSPYGLDLHDPIVEHCVGLGWVVVNIEYRRMSPDDQTQDSTGEVGWEELSSDVKRALAVATDEAKPTVVIGHSAGGQLALWAGAQDDLSVDAVVALAPVADLFLADALELSEHATKALFGTTGAERPDLYASASPVNLVPLGIPQLVIHGRADENVPIEMAVEYVETAQLCGDAVEFSDPAGVDHFNVIDPKHAVWRTVDKFLDHLGLNQD